MYTPLLFIVGTAAYDKLKSLLTGKALLNDIKQLSPDAQNKLLRGVSCHLEPLASKDDWFLLARLLLQVVLNFCQIEKIMLQKQLLSNIHFYN